MRIFNLNIMEQNDKNELLKSIFDLSQIQKTGHHCDCECHKPGIEITHTFPCCDKTYQKFKN